MKDNPTEIGKNINISLFKTNPYLPLFKEIERGERVLKVSGLAGSSKPHLASSLLRETGRSLLYLTSSREKAERIGEDIAFFSGQVPSFLFRKKPASRAVLFSSISGQTSEKINWLFSARERKILVAEAPALLERAAPKEFLESSVIPICKDTEIIREEFLNRLYQMGYVRTDFVERVGETSVRGGIVDVFSPTEKNPVRVEFLGDRIASIRLFSPQDQVSYDVRNRFTILPVSEIILTKEATECAVSYVRKRAGELGTPASRKLSLIEDIQRSTQFPDIDWLLPAFYPRLDSVLSYLPQDTLLVLDDPEEISTSVRDWLSSLQDLYDAIKNRLRVFPELWELYLTEDELISQISGFQSIFVEDIEILGDEVKKVRFDTTGISIRGKSDSKSPFEILSDEISSWKKNRFSVHIVSSTEGEKKRLLQILSEYGIDEGVQAHVGSLSSGFIFPEAQTVVLTEGEIVGEKRKIMPSRRSDVPSAFVKSFSQLKPGDYIVHVDFGIGIFRGLKRLKVEEFEGDFIECEYAGGDKVYVPVVGSHLVQKYIGGTQPPRIDKLGKQRRGFLSPQEIGYLRSSSSLSLMKKPPTREPPSKML